MPENWLFLDEKGLSFEWQNIQIDPGIAETFRFTYVYSEESNKAQTTIGCRFTYPGNSGTITEIGPVFRLYPEPYKAQIIHKYFPTEQIAAGMIRGLQVRKYKPRMYWAIADATALSGTQAMALRVETLS